MIYKHTKKLSGVTSWLVYVTNVNIIYNVSMFIRQNNAVGISIFIENVFPQSQICNLCNSLFASMYKLALSLHELNITCIRKNANFNITKSLTESISVMSVSNKCSTKTDPCGTQQTIFSSEHLSSINSGKMMFYLQIN